MDFKRFIMIMEYLDHGAVAVPPHWLENDMGAPVFLPQIDLALPSTSKSGRISMIIKDKNPILLQMEDGTRLYFSHDQFRRIKGSPAVGRTITVVFQRQPGDRSNMPSQIAACSVT